jgi:hypothetical protein
LSASSRSECRRLDLVALLVPGHDDAHRDQLLVDQEEHVLLADLAAEARADPVRDLLGVALPVDRAGDQVEQPGQLHHLAVAAPRDVLGLDGPGALVLTVQPQARARPGDGEGPAGRTRGAGEGHGGGETARPRHERLGLAVLGEG